MRLNSITAIALLSACLLPLLFVAFVLWFVLRATRGPALAR